MNNYQKYIALSRYARHLPEEQRRETWEETVKRWINYFQEKFNSKIPPSLWQELDNSILNLDVMPSMRSLWTAGHALERDNAAGFGCWYVVINNQKVFDEAMYLLMCGSGVGYSVERQYINELPDVPFFKEVEDIIYVADSKIGWATALKELINFLFLGNIPKFDFSKIRPKGTPLKTFGGRASGHEPLELLFKNIIRIFKNSSGRKLHSIECHDIMCHIANTVNVGGVRRSACICLTNLSDDRMRRAKTGDWQDFENQRRLANISVAYTEKPDFISFLKEWYSLYESKSGERGIVNRIAFKNKCKKINRDDDHEFGCNPCGEVILRPFQACNLSEVVIKPYDTWKSLAYKVTLATIIGTMQSALTNFRYLRKIYQQNCEEERLLGVSLTGIMDNHITATSDISYKHLEHLKLIAKETNLIWAEKLGIRKAKAITCVKPSGTVSQLVNCSSGIHPRYSNFYIRRATNDKSDPIGQFLVKAGVPFDEDDRNYYFKFPEAAPLHSKTIKDFSATEQLRIWKTYADEWCDHNPSQTISYNDNDFLKVGQWVWENFDCIGGLSFFPKDDHVYKNPPYEEISKEEYLRLKKEMPKIKWEEFKETYDTTTGANETACGGGGCEL